MIWHAARIITNVGFGTRLCPMCCKDMVCGLLLGGNNACAALKSVVRLHSGSLGVPAFVDVSPIMYSSSRVNGCRKPNPSLQLKHKAIDSLSVEHVLYCV